MQSHAPRAVCEWGNCTCIICVPLFYLNVFSVHVHHFPLLSSRFRHGDIAQHAKLSTYLLSVCKFVTPARAFLYCFIFSPSLCLSESSGMILGIAITYNCKCALCCEPSLSSKSERVLDIDEILGPHTRKKKPLRPTACQRPFLCCTLCCSAI